MGKNYLLALENDRTEEFANQAYLKGFLRTYAAYLGLNPDDLIRHYDKQQAQYKGLPAAMQQAGAGGDAEIPKKRISLRKFVLPAFLLLLIIITASIVNRSDIPPRREQAAHRPSSRSRRRQPRQCRQFSRCAPASIRNPLRKKREKSRSPPPSNPTIRRRPTRTVSRRNRPRRRKVLSCA